MICLVIYNHWTLSIFIIYYTLIIWLKSHFTYNRESWFEGVYKKCELLILCYTSQLHTVFTRIIKYSLKKIQRTTYVFYYRIIQTFLDTVDTWGMQFLSDPRPTVEIWSPTRSSRRCSLFFTWTEHCVNQFKNAHTSVKIY